MITVLVWVIVLASGLLLALATPSIIEAIYDYRNQGTDHGSVSLPTPRNWSENDDAVIMDMEWFIPHEDFNAAEDKCRNGVKEIVNKAIAILTEDASWERWIQRADRSENAARSFVLAAVPL